MQLFPDRVSMIKALIPDGSIVAEIGVFKGDFTRQLIKEINPSKLYLFDLFTGVTCSGDQDGNNVVHANMEQSYTDIKNWHMEQITLCKGDSSIELSKYDDNMFDMIYIDGDHSYEGCKKDLKIALQKIKIGGWIMGHDYEMNMSKAKSSYNFGVKRAVDEFCATYNQTIYAKGLDGCVSYAIHIIKKYMV